MPSNIDPQQMLSQVLAQTREKVPGRDPKKLKELSQQFEAIYIQQMFKEMRNTVPDDGLIERGNADDIFTQLQDAEAAKVMAKQGGIGLAEIMLQQMLGEDSE